MKANLENIQKIYDNYPNSWVVNGIRIDNYSMSNDHYNDGWREVVIPEISELQKLSDNYILINDIVTKEVINLNTTELEELVIQIDLEYTNKISLLMNKHLEKFIIEGIEIPSNIIEKRNDLRKECNDKINEFGITDFIYRKRIIGL